jgi:hypothetical protein
VRGISREREMALSKDGEKKVSPMDAQTDEGNLAIHLEREWEQYFCWGWEKALWKEGERG